MRIQRIIFPLLICAFLCGPTMLLCAIEAGVDVPFDLTAEPATYLEGNAQGIDLPDGVTIRSFANGSLQKAADVAINHFIPARATAITVNAALQRTAIQASNVLVGQNCYPTYFDSERIYLPEPDAVSYVPGRMTDDIQNEWRMFAEGVKSAAERHPDKRFLIYVVGGLSEPAYNPAYDLVLSPVRPSDCVNIMESILDDCENATVMTHAYDDAESYFQHFFRTDHHWNINGAFAAYDQIASTFDLETISGGGTWNIPDYRFTGATARWGVDLLSETVFDVNEDFSMLTATRIDGSTVNCGDHAAFWDSEPLARHFFFYDRYYDSLGDCVITGGQGTRSALLVGNSYRAAIQRPLAYSYKSLTVNNQLHPAWSVTATLDQQISDAQADDVFFIANAGRFTLDPAYWN